MMIKFKILINNNKNNKKLLIFNQIYIKNLPAKKHKTLMHFNNIIVKDNKRNNIFDIFNLNISCKIRIVLSNF